ncbi:CYTH domain-containing protein [Ornithinibacillus bavariensis]|uniref:CYTH domain-containing protein n=1 Tax=Ornithinibacillus bavariensis TaxID=545502 RepID=A0A919X594_9BACI|nr:CYTH domain-containing protein [Ornithinibacillus bavariensis]GIO25771.1 CYTH domain-containing protein [Ornithinibacillus bavariensis]HAM79823.1 adenylate cyclase [Ornithinibacillus sp.]
MTQEIEIEFKNLLTKQEYLKLLNHLPFPKDGQKQINHYFETIDFKLREQNSALRIREKNGTYQLTLKEPHQDGLLETHDDLTQMEAMQWMNGNPIAKLSTSKRLLELGIRVEELKPFGNLTTIRREYKEDGIIFVLDQSFYHNQEDYELEIEANNHNSGLQAINKVLNDWNITKKDTPNKIARFFMSLP